MRGLKPPFSLHYIHTHAYTFAHTHIDKIGEQSEPSSRSWMENFVLPCNILPHSTTHYLLIPGMSRSLSKPLPYDEQVLKHNKNMCFSWARHKRGLAG